MQALVTKHYYFSSEGSAKYLSGLKQIGITHIVNVATGVACFFPEHFTYHFIEVVDDSPTQNIRQHFDDALNFMRNAVEKGGKVRKIKNRIITLNFELRTLMIFYIRYF